MPLSVAHLKYTVRGIRLYHVQFFSDNALTHWIAPTSIIPFEGFDKLKEYLIDLKAKVGEKPCCAGPATVSLLHSFLMTTCFLVLGEPGLNYGTVNDYSYLEILVSGKRVVTSVCIRHGVIIICNGNRLQSITVFKYS